MVKCLRNAWWSLHEKGTRISAGGLRHKLSRNFSTNGAVGLQDRSAYHETLYSQRERKRERERGKFDLYD